MTDHRPRKPAEWEVIDGIKILDPDGWRVDGKSFDEPISRDEWNKRMWPSTIMTMPQWSRETGE